MKSVMSGVLVLGGASALSYNESLGMCSYSSTCTVSGVEGYEVFYLYS